MIAVSGVRFLGTSPRSAWSSSRDVAARARVIAAADDARRRIERDLHDGAQQQLVTLALAMRSTEGRIPTGQEQLKAEVGGFADARERDAVDLGRILGHAEHRAVGEEHLEIPEGGIRHCAEYRSIPRRSAVRSVSTDGRSRWWVSCPRISMCPRRGRSTARIACTCPSSEAGFSKGTAQATRGR